MNTPLRRCRGLLCISLLDCKNPKIKMPPSISLACAFASSTKDFKTRSCCLHDYCVVGRNTHLPFMPSCTNIPSRTFKAGLVYLHLTVNFQKDELGDDVLCSRLCTKLLKRANVLLSVDSIALCRVCPLYTVYDYYSTHSLILAL
jgi:hypothetical protein